MPALVDQRCTRLAALALLLATAACTGQPPTPAAGGESVRTTTSQRPAPREKPAPCPARTRSATALIAEVRGMLEGPTDGSAWLCRYRHVGAADRDLLLHGGKPLAKATAERLHDAFVHRNRGMVDCAGDPREPLYAVIDRDPQGRPRIVTVDLAMCATIEAQVAGVEEYGLATEAHRRLLEEAWRGS